MKDIESLEEFYKGKFDWIPENLKNEIGHFNVFLHEPVVIGTVKSLPYKRRDYFKIMLVVGDVKINYADQVILVKKQALFFSNPLIPYTCENLDRIQSGIYCIFNQHFVHQFTNLLHYTVFQPKGDHVFELSDDQAKEISNLFERMFEEINSDYIHKYDVLRNLVFELLHFAMKMKPSSKLGKQPMNASQRITTLFFELLERQFPIDDSHQKVNFRKASDFALQLNLHINHLNRAVKEITKKTTTQLIAERILQESKILLKHSSWNVTEIGFALGFIEVTHFNNFFKNHMECSPLQFRKG